MVRPPPKLEPGTTMLSGAIICPDQKLAQDLKTGARRHASDSDRAHGRTLSERPGSGAVSACGSPRGDFSERAIATRGTRHGAGDRNPGPRHADCGRRPGLRSGSADGDHAGRHPRIHVLAFSTRNSRYRPWNAWRRFSNCSLLQSNRRSRCSHSCRPKPESAAPRWR